MALAFEAGEPGVLDRPPRPARERMFDRLMIERTLLAGAVFGGIGLFAWQSWMGRTEPRPYARGPRVVGFAHAASIPRALVCE